MALSDIFPSIAYATNGVSTIYPVPFYFSQFPDLVVTFKNSLGQVTTKLYNSDYTLAGILDPKLNTYSQGGTLTTTPALSAGGTLRITRKTPRTQNAVYNPQDPFPAGAHEAALDRAVLVLQDALDLLGFIGLGDGPPTYGIFLNGQWIKNANIVPGGSIGWIYLSGNWYEWGNVSED